MSKERNTYKRAALITKIAQRQPAIGRTALMKYLYLLQEVKGIDLGYRFDLYSYGPFDSTVLSDITTAVSWGGAKQTVCHYSTGTGYELSVSENAHKVLDTSKEFIESAEEAVNWVVDNFRGYGAGDMELIATMVYVDQEAKAIKATLSENDLIKRSLEIKPRYSREQAETKLAKLKSIGALSATA